jgi:preprotein translocase subunit SecD
MVGPVPADILGGPAVFEKDSARATLGPTGGWQVVVGLSATGSTAFNALASACFDDPQQGGQTCPTGQLAIVMDEEIITYPRVNARNFQDEVSITGSFSESEARELARVLDRGAFPVQVHAETVQTVSATLGEDSMRASIFAGLAGVALVLALLAYFYRRLILVVVAGIAVWGMLIYSASTFISETTNYALTLAGVTGIIVAIGVTVDTYVVYFERLKEEVRHGRTIRNSALRSFKATWRTIVAADVVALIAAIVLFVLSVGSVRGFALYLGVTTVCDLIVCFFYTRPAVGLLADSGWLDQGDTFGLKDYE